MYNNFKKEHPGLALKDRIWSAARASYESRFASEMESLKEFDVEAFNWLVKHTTPKEWTRSHFRILSKCDILLNNLCESFNSIILDAREQPIIGMLETIRFYLMVRMEKKREWMKKQKGQLCPKIQKKFEKIKDDARTCIATAAGVWKYEVRCMYGDRYTVDLVSRTCSCRKWDLSGIPCSHAYSAITLTDEEPETFVHDCYSKEAYMRAYSPVIGPMDGEELWPKANKGPLLPPEKIKLPGRPKKVRKREPDEVPAPKKNSKQVQKLSRTGLMSYKCRKCKMAGHNSRKCMMVEINEGSQVHTRETAFVSNEKNKNATGVPASSTSSHEGFMPAAPMASQNTSTLFTSNQVSENRNHVPVQ